MGLIDLFRPKYHHSDASVRAEAVRQLGADQADLLADLARTDRDPSVRRIAIDKIEDADVLASLVERESESALREQARARAAQIWTARAVSAEALSAGRDAIDGLVRIGSQRALADVASRASDAAVRDAALAKLGDPKALADLARSATAQVSTRTTALARIDDPEVLRSIAVDEQRKELALAALDRIEDPDVLNTVAVKAKNKAVRARARKKLADIAPPPEDTSSPEDKRRHAERVQLLRRGESLAQGSEWRESAKLMAEIERDWDALGAPGPDDADVVARFDKARQRYHARRQAYLSATVKKEKKAARQDAGGQGREPDTRRAPAQNDQGAGEPATAGKADGADAPQASSEAGEQRAAGQETSAPPAAASDTPAASAAAVADGDEPGAEQAQGAGQDDEAKRRQREEAERERKERQANSLAAVGQIIQELEAASEASKRKQLDRVLQKTQKAFAELDLPQDSDEQVQRYHALRKAAQAKAQELREAEDWERWANVPRQEALIAKAEALLQDEDDSKLGDRLKSLQIEWKTVGPVPQKKSRELWERFKSTCDQVYERVKVTRSRANEEMAVNLQRKEALCEQVEVLAESTDWDTTAEEIKRLQREWRDIGPVPRKKSDAIWKRFRAACDRFFERRKPHLEERLAELTENLKKKEALCERVEVLAESSDWKDASLQIRALQRDWRDIGLVPRKDANTINKRFRAACDRFFQRRDEYRDAERLAREQAVEALRAQMLELIEGKPGGAVGAAAPAAAPDDAGEGAAVSVADEAGGGSPDGTSEEAAEPASDQDGDQDADEAAAPATTLADRALRIRAALRELPLSEDQERDLYALAEELYRKVLTAEPAAFRGTELDLEANRQRKEKLCARAEELAPEPTESAPVEAQTPEQMAERLRAALAKNALSSSLAKSTDGRNIADTVAELEASWRRLGPVPGPEGDALEARFQAACKRARESAGLDNA